MTEPKDEGQAQPEEVTCADLDGSAPGTMTWDRDGAGGDATEAIAQATRASPDLAWSAEDASTEPATHRQPWVKALLIATAILIPLVVAATVVAVPRWMSHQNTPAPTSPRPTPPPAVASPTLSDQTQVEDLVAATAAAQEKADRHASGDFAGEWLLYVRTVREGIAQQDFVRYSKACSSIGVKLKATGVRMEGLDHAIVRIEVLGVTRSSTWAYEEGAWHQLPDEFLSSNFGKNADELISADKAQGNCTK
ncbi:hypothetical protein [Mycobacterium simiae]|uniref:Uncharacterized protein n=1 Tax=Mycobacterium simiae TaxID=1784 RepID=A0A1X0XXU0_MYCSI|nr:hypothetical protein [Mycobacterium simiae]ORJ57773.1 hypothetical protein B5M45_19360 [Mycobacterium simiae]